MKSELSETLGTDGERLDMGPGLNRVCAAALRLLKSSSALVSLTGRDDVHVVGGAGLSSTSVGLDVATADSICARVAEAGTARVVVDATAEPDLAGIPAVAAGIVGSYLGVPLVTADGTTRGALCVYEPVPRSWTSDDLVVLEELGRWVVTELEFAHALTGQEGDRLAWRLAVDAAGVGAFEWDLTTGELRWDARLLELFGTSEASFGATIEAFERLVHPEDRARVTEALTEAIDSCGEYAAEYRIVRPDGESRWVSARGRALADRPGGRAVQVLGAAYDTTAVRDGDARVGRVLESMPTAFFQLDGDWRFSYANSEAERLLATSHSDLVGSTIWELFPEAVGSDFETFYRRAVETGEPQAFDAYYPAPLDATYEVRAWPSPDGLAVYFVDVTARHQAQRQLDETARRARIVAEVSGATSGTLDPTEGVSRLAEILVPLLADWCVVTLVEDVNAGDWRRGLRDVGWAHAEPTSRELVRRYADLRLGAMSDDSFLAQALSQRDPIVIEADAAERVASVLAPGEAQELLRTLDPASAIVVPLRGRNRTVGVLSAFRGQDRVRFSRDDQELLADVGTRAGLALDNARLYAEQRDLAETLQRSLLTEPPQPDHLRIAVRYQPAAEVAQVGGDWYDAFLQPHIDPVRAGVIPEPAGPTPASDDEDPAEAAARRAALEVAVNVGAVDTVVVIGDVVGHDVAAAAAMGQVRGLLRGIAVHSGATPADVVRGLDHAMAALQVDTTATAVVARIEHDPAYFPGSPGTAPRAVRVRFANAGHPPPVLVSPDGTATVLESAEGADLLLGLDPRTQRREQTATLERGATLILYTDGLVERRGQLVDDGIAALTSLLGDLMSSDVSLEELCDALLSHLVPDNAEDDVALLAVRLIE
ncbi:SpoIIE family protein phosphatase [Nocardioides sp. SR21]|uniref:SpoIIE family protein phosphatase n=1 Tax=Nocardioides sp. SR21 TaxID=2919501 RepID=UPI001FA9793D|nr:SpoIIE family protein phosphatase [Nocardioides sp. SR21]